MLLTSLSSLSFKTGNWNLKGIQELNHELYCIQWVRFGGAEKELTIWRITFGKVNKLFQRSLTSCKNVLLFKFSFARSSSFNSTYLFTEVSWTSTRSLTSPAIKRWTPSRTRDAITERACSGVFPRKGRLRWRSLMLPLDDGVRDQ